MKQKEGSLQERIQRLIQQRGGWVIKEWGNMTKAPGIPDLLFCYKGLFCAIECKVDDNTTSKQQEIHLRKIRKAGGLTMVAWSTDDAEKMLNAIDETLNYVMTREHSYSRCLQNINDYVTTMIREEWYKIVKDDIVNEVEDD